DPERKLLRTGGLFDGLPRRAMVTWIPPAMSSRSFELFLCTVRGIARIGNLPVPGPKLFPEGMTMKLENIRVGMVLRLKREVLDSSCIATVPPLLPIGSPSRRYGHVRVTPCRK